MTGKKSSNSANNQDQLYKIATTRYLSHSYKFKLNCFTGNGKFTYVDTLILLLNYPTIVQILSQNCCIFCPEKNCVCAVNIYGIMMVVIRVKLSNNVLEISRNLSHDNWCPTLLNTSNSCILTHFCHRDHSSPSKSYILNSLDLHIKTFSKA